MKKSKACQGQAFRNSSHSLEENKSPLPILSSPRHPPPPSPNPRGYSLMSQSDKELSLFCIIPISDDLFTKKSRERHAIVH